MVNGIGAGAFAEGLMQGYNFGHGIQEQKKLDAYQAEDRADLQTQRHERDISFQERQKLFQQQQDDRTIKQNGMMIYHLTHNPDGSLKPVDAAGHAQIVRLINNTPGIKDFLGNGQNVDQSAPLAGLNVTPDGMIVPELNTTDPKTGQASIKPMTANRTSDPNDPVVALSASQLDNELGSFFGPHGAWGQAKMSEREKLAIQHKYKLDEIAAQAKARSGSGDKAPAAVKTIQWVAKNLFNGDVKKASEWYKTAPSRAPQQMAASLYIAARKDPANVMKTDDEIKQMVKQAMAFSQSFNPNRAAPAPAAGPGAVATPTQPAAPAAVTDPNQPPVAGARKAPDGNWYVHRNGTWNKVVQ